MQNPVVLSSRQVIDLVEPKPQNSHPRLSTRRVLYIRFLRWLEKASSTAIVKAFLRTLSAVLLAFAIFMPQEALAAGTYIVTWNSYRLPLFLAALVLMFNAKRLYRLARSVPMRLESRGNQHTFEGVPVPALAQYLVREQAFKQTDSIDKLGLSQGQYARIADKLEAAEILFKDPQQKNARVLRPIELEQLVTTLRALTDGAAPPLVFDPTREIWVERDGAFDRWCLSQEFTRRKISEETAKAERRVERLEEKAETMRPKAMGPLAELFAPLTGQ